MVLNRRGGRIALRGIRGEGLRHQTGPLVTRRNLIDLEAAFFLLEAKRIMYPRLIRWA